jgi:hypothetical protein
VASAARDDRPGRVGTLRASHAPRGHAAAIAAVDAVYGRDEAMEACGDFEQSAWIAPETVTEFVKGSAGRAEAFYRQQLQPATQNAIRDFLNSVWIGTNHSADMNWEMIARAYPVMLRNYPA